jgi:hypothetical protein
MSTPHNKTSCLITSVTAAVTGTGSAVTFEIDDPCNKLTNASLIKQVLNALVAEYISLEDFEYGNDCRDGSLCCCGYPIQWTLADKSATVNFGSCG